MTWHLLIDRATGDLVSQGTVIADDAAARFDVVDIGMPPADDQLWDASTRAFVARPAPVLIDRLDDIETLFQNNADFMAVYGALNAARKAQLRTGIRAVLARVLRRYRWREARESPEMGFPDA